MEELGRPRRFWTPEIIGSNPVYPTASAIALAKGDNVHHSVGEGGYSRRVVRKWKRTVL